MQFLVPIFGKLTARSNLVFYFLQDYFSGVICCVMPLTAAPVQESLEVTKR